MFPFPFSISVKSTCPSKVNYAHEYKYLEFWFNEHFDMDESISNVMIMQREHSIFLQLSHNLKVVSPWLCTQDYTNSTRLYLQTHSLLTHALYSHGLSPHLNIFLGFISLLFYKVMVCYYHMWCADHYAGVGRDPLTTLLLLILPFNT